MTTDTQEDGKTARTDGGEPAPEHIPEPDGWSFVDRSAAGNVWEHTSGTTARAIPDGPSAASLEIDGEEVFAVKDRHDEPFWEMVEAALDGWPENVDAYRAVGNTGLDSFGDSERA